ncbi:uncharacterized protein T551_03108, partial [Pneumocystis jirovecii RU7]
HSLARAVARAVKRQAKAQKDEIGEEHVLAFLLKKDGLEEQKCKKKLKEYCQGLSDAGIKTEQIDKKLKDFCNDAKQDEKCKQKASIEEKCNGFRAELENVLKKEIEDLRNDDCEKKEQCLFLEDACPTLIEKCNKLRNMCYQKERNEVAKEALLRALSGSLKKSDTCEKKIKNVCIVLKEESDELMQKCLSLDSTCLSLVQAAKDKCSSLKKDIETALTKNTSEVCLLLLEQCYFHDRSCESEPLKCNDLINKCESVNITYTPPDTNFDPTKEESTLVEEIGLKSLYTKAVKKGVHIGKPPKADATALLALLILDPSLANKATKKEKCEKIIEDKCKDPQEYGVLKDLCEGTKASKDGKQKCEELDDDIENTCKIFTSKVLDYHLFDTKKNNGIIMWRKLPTFLSEKECTNLMSYCFYFEKSCDKGEDACKNIKAACYKKGLDGLANEVLQSKLRGKLHGSKKEWLKTFQKKLLEVCQEVKKENNGVFPNNELFLLCVEPTRAAIVLPADLRMKVIFLLENLNKKRDFPTKENCEELEEKCKVLLEDSREIEWPCHTLNWNCDRLRNVEQLKEKLLEEKTEDLDKLDSCKKKLGKRCNEWVGKGRSQFTLACIAQNTTCKIITKDVKSKCDRLEKYIKNGTVLNDAKEETKKESICEFWIPYCERFMSSCKNLANTGTKDCVELRKECSSFIKKKELENKVLDELKGNLSSDDECKKTLDKYCAVWANASNGLEVLCIDTSNAKTKNDAKVRKKLCKKLIARITEQCPKLFNELAEAKDKLKKKKEEYKRIKEEAEKAMEAANFILSRAKGPDNNKSVNKNSSDAPKEGKDTTGFKLVRRSAKVHVTEKELAAFDLVAQTFNLYVELKEICQHSQKGCGFRKECANCEEVCKAVDRVCLRLEPLKIKPYEVKTVTETNITTVTETVKEAEKTVGDGEKCKSLTTSDTWITHTSTHTSTSTTTSTVTSRITLTSTRRCKPTKCTTGEGDEAGEVKPSEGLRMSGWSVMRGVLVAMMISFMI